MSLPTILYTVIINVCHLLTFKFTRFSGINAKFATPRVALIKKNRTFLFDTFITNMQNLNASG